MLDCRNSDQPLPNDANHPQIQPSLVIEAEPFEIEMKAIASNKLITKKLYLVLIRESQESGYGYL